MIYSPYARYTYVRVTINIISLNNQFKLILFTKISNELKFYK